MALSPSVDTLLQRLAPWGDRVRTDPAALQAVAQDASHEPPGDAAAVLFPQTTAEVSQAAQNAHALGVPLVPRGAGTGKAGACIPQSGQVVVDLSRMNRILALRPDDLFATVQPGVITATLDKEAQQHGLMYPPDPASWESCTLGGNIATNAGGPRAVKYGVTQRYVWGLEVVLMDGTVLRCGRHSIKGVAGLDLTSLMVGSEGTLGFVTEATLHLIPAPRGVETGWLTFADPGQASRAAAAIFKAGILPRMLELLDAPALQAVQPLCQWPMPQSHAALLVETDGLGPTQAMEELTRLCDVACQNGAAQALIAKSEKEREAMRRTRRLVSSALKGRYPHKVSDDIAVPRGAMAGLLQEAQIQAQSAGLGASAYGHLGDGNLHVNLLCVSPEERERAQGVRDKLWRHAVALGGTISGEHGIGLSKRQALSLEQAPALLQLQKRVKAAFDGKNLLNPGKVWPT